MRKSGFAYVITLLAVLVLAGTPSLVLAHCDTMDGPTAADGKAALEQGKLTPALKWIKPDVEKELQLVFDHVMAVRKTDSKAQELADRYFLETLIRLHRAGEGAPYTGLKPAGTEVNPGIVAADKALDNGDISEVIKHLTEEVQHGVQERFEKAHTLQQQKDQSVEAGRQYVEAYVSYVHYVENLLNTTQAAGSHEAEGTQNEEHRH